MSAWSDLPSVDQVLRRVLPIDGLPRDVITDEIRSAIDERRAAIRAGSSEPKNSIEDAVRERLTQLFDLTLKPVINATGVILHTNLGRAPLPEFAPIAGYSNVEYDLVAGKRGRRDDQLAPLLERLLGHTAIAVNNNAAAVYLVLNEMAAGGEVIVSRGELIEIGDGFRIPDIMARSGGILREVGTTNRTSVDDYRQAVTDRTRVILRVYPSNFHISGFTARPSLQELTALGRERGVPVYEDLGSGCVVDLRSCGIDEPLVQESLSAGANLVTFSCDKLLGGPQAGIIAGDPELVKRVRLNPMYRAFRIDKLSVQALQTTLKLLLRRDWKSIPVLRMIFSSKEEIRARAERVSNQLQALPHILRDAESPIGGGSTPDQLLSSYVLEFQIPDPASFARRLRTGSTPVIARIENDHLLIDLRTVSDEEETPLISAILAATA